MKVFIKLKGEPLYLTSSETWTGRALDAQDFVSFYPAMKFCHNHDFQDVEILYWFEDPAYNFVLKV